MTQQILIVMHNYAEIPALVKKNLEFLGYKNVDFMFYSQEKFKYKNGIDRLQNILRKTFLRDKKFKEKLRLEFIEKTLLEKAPQLKRYDRIIVMNTDFFSDEFLTILKTKTSKLVGNHWDGLQRTPEIYPKLSYFDDFYVFDKVDVDESKNIHFLTNFYFNFERPKSDFSIAQEVYYLGTFVEQRLAKLKAISEKISKHNISQKINLFSWEKRAAIGELKFINTLVSYEENIQNVESSKVLIDLKLKAHNGLSFRFFEALYLEKKLITDNKEVKNYDFYKKENIFIIDEDSEEELVSFIHQPYVKIDEELIKKYSFESWFKTLIS